jgi:catechol 2,3-dioxygenase-like lactoylglutathione lyase family enzyme
VTYRYHHVGIVVPDLAAGQAEFGLAMGLQWRPSMAVTSTMLDAEGNVHEVRSHFCWSKGGVPAVELVEAVPGSPLVAPAGSPIQHIGIWVDDLPAERARLEAAGWKHYATPGAGRQVLMRGPSGLILECCDVNIDRPWICDLFPVTSEHYCPDPDGSTG